MWLQGKRGREERGGDGEKRGKRGGKWRELSHTSLGLAKEYSNVSFEEERGEEGGRGGEKRGEEGKRK